MGFRTSTGQRAAELVAEAVAAAWCGSSAEAAPVRAVCSKLVTMLIARADAASGGVTSSTLLKLLQKLAPASDHPIVDGAGSREVAAAQAVSRLLLGFLPAHLRSLDRLIASLRKPAQPPAPQASPPPAATSKERAPTKDEQELARQLTAAMMPTVGLSARWPSVERLGEELQRRLGILKKLPGFGASVDVANWLAQVPIQAAASELVATAITDAFAVLRASPLGSSGLVGSNAELGSVVHERLAAAVAFDFVLAHPDRYLVAENSVFLPRSTVAVPLAAVTTALQDLTKDYSLTALAQSRGSKSPLMVRAAGAKTSREDLIVFVGSAAGFTSTASMFDGQPEVYEIKPIDSLTQAVSQVTAYSWNYLLASLQLQLGLLLRRPGARLVNSLMLPASPEHRTISLPVITVTEAAALATASMPLGTAAEIAKIVQALVSKKIRAGKYLAIPFMVTGLYGIIPYFVIDTKVLQQALDAVLAAIAAALVAALIVYLRGMKLLDELAYALDQLGGVIVAFAILFGLALVILLLTPVELPILIPAAALALAVIIATRSPSTPKRDDAEAAVADNLTVHVGPMIVVGLSAPAFAGWMASARQAFMAMWTLADPDSGGTIAPPQ